MVFKMIPEGEVDIFDDVVLDPPPASHRDTCLFSLFSEDTSIGRSLHSLLCSSQTSKSCPVFHMTQEFHWTLVAWRNPVLTSSLIMFFRQCTTHWLYTDSFIPCRMNHKWCFLFCNSQHVLHLREVASMKRKTQIQIHFSVADTQQCKEWLGQLTQMLQKCFKLWSFLFVSHSGLPNSFWLLAVLRWRTNNPTKG